MRKKLKKRYHHLFEEFYHTPTNPSCFRSSRKRRYIQNNPDVGVRVILGFRNCEETVFTCLTETIADTVGEYFVSSYDYNVNRQININGMNDYIAGRFVFSHGYEDRVILVALAEETGQPFVQGAESVEAFYLQKRENRVPGE